MKKLIKDLNSGAIYKNENGYLFCNEHGEFNDNVFSNLKIATEELYISIAYDYHGSAIRDNSRKDKIEMGQDIDENGFEENTYCNNCGNELTTIESNDSENTECICFTCHEKIHGCKPY